MKIINEKLEVIMFNRKTVCFYLALLAIVFVSASFNMNAATIHTGKNAESKEKDQEQLQNKTYNNVYDLQQNSISNIQFYTTNYGIFGYDVARGVGGGYWPRGSLNQYIFAGGIWIGAEKYKNPTDSLRTRYVSITYNPNSGKGWYVPGRINYGGPNSTEFPNIDAVDLTDVLKYRTYFSTDFIPSTGEPINSAHKYYWPIWDASRNEEDTLKTNRYLGYFIPQTELRNTATHPRGPAFISGEDIFSTYKDTDLSRYEGGITSRRERGYPLRLQIDQMIYSWGFGDYKDFIFLKYEITNYSADTLWNCWLAPIQDVDIARAPATSFGAGNDRAKYFDCDASLNMAVQWTNADRGEASHGFGYLGFDFLESPAVVVLYDTTFVGTDTILTPLGPNQYDPEIHGPDAPRFVRKDKKVYKNEEQLGLVTFRNWPIEEDRLEDDERYNFISSGQQDGDDAPGDKRFLMSTGPFHMRPGDTVRTVVGMILANSSKGIDADGTCEDMKDLERKDKFAQEVYDNNFRAPTPPDRAIITNWEGYNHALKIEWDNTSEMSIDIYEKGLDFMGYKIYRARRTNLDTFALNEISPGGDYPSGKGPFGWKQIAQYNLQAPFYKSQHRGGTDPNDLTVPFIDELHVVGPYVDANNRVIDSMAITVMRRGLGMFFVDDSTLNSIKDFRPIPVGLDTAIFYNPWGKYWARIIERDPNIFTNRTGQLLRGTPQNSVVLRYQPEIRNEIFDSVLVGVAYFNRALLKFNPLYYKLSTYSRSRAHVDSVFSFFPDGVVGQWKWEYAYDSTGAKTDSAVVRLTTDSIYIKESQKITELGNMIDIWVPRAMNNIMNDSSHIAYVNNLIYDYIQKGLIKVNFADFEQRIEVRRDVIGPYMASITNNRTFYDVGDDNKNGYITPDADPTKTEKLINNVDYFYKVLAYDEGDYQQPTPSKINTSSPGLTNMVKTFPTAAPAGDMPSIQIIHVDSNLIGGLYNFRFFAVDNDRLIQRFEGDELILKFEPFWSISSYPFDTTNRNLFTNFGLYRNMVTLWSKNSGDTLYRGLVSFESKPCDLSYYEFFTENAASYVLSDEPIYDPSTDTFIDFGVITGKGIRTRTGRFSSGDFTYPNYCYTSSWLPNAYGILGFSFDFTISQYGGRFRPDSLTLTTAYGPGVNANTPVNFMSDVLEENPTLTPDIAVVQRTMPVGLNFNFRGGAGFIEYGSFNNGPGIYEVEFLTGGSEDGELEWGYKLTNPEPTSNTFQIEYLHTKVRNIIDFKIPNSDMDSVIVTYPDEVKHLSIQPVEKDPNYGVWNYEVLYPNPTTLGYDGGGVAQTNEFIGKYNIHAHGWISNSGYKREQGSPIIVPGQMARPKSGILSGKKTSYTGLPQQSDNGLGRYYKTAISVDGADTLDFTHIINISGVQFALDFANKGRSNVSAPQWVRKPQEEYNIWTAVDFKPGDKIYLRTYGGALGLPMPGATVIAKVGKSAPDNEQYTDGQLDRVSVVPNPYYVSHEGVKSPYDSKIYFTKLPPRCTIQIYTVAGDLVNTLEHDEYQNEGDVTRNAVQVWDLLSSNLQRVQSQTFVAVITTPNGAQTVKKFSVIVGGFRIIEQN